MEQFKIIIFHGDQAITARFADTIEQAKKHAARMLDDFGETNAIPYECQIRQGTKFVWSSDGLLVG